jgi:hypothetical protein
MLPGSSKDCIATCRAGLLAVAMSAIGPSLVWSDENPDKISAFVCITEHETGFSFDERKKVWMPKVFNFREKWLIQKPIYRSNPLGTDGAAYAVYRFGVYTSVLESACKNDFNEAGYLYCSYGLQTFTMNCVNNRFIKTDTNGYVNRNIALLPGVFLNDGNGRPTLGIGSCVKWDGPVFD